MSQDKQQVSSSAPAAAATESKSQQQTAAATTATQIMTKASKNEEQHQETRLPAATTDNDNIKETPNGSRQMRTKLVANLHSAANEGKVELVRLLLRCGADVNAQDEQFGNTALHQAAWNGFSETVQVLCKYRANTSIRNKAQFTPLHLACQQGHNQTARLLLMANAKTEAKNSYGDTPLHTAARYGHAGVARILLSAKSNLNQVNKNNDTPLHIAAAMGRRKITKILMQNGAEPAIKNKQGETAMDIALRKDLIDIQELIANPPPATHKHSQAPGEAAAELSQLERRFGQLYTTAPATATTTGGHNLHRRPATNSATRRHRRAKQQRQHRCNSSNDDSSGHMRKCRLAAPTRAAPQLASGELEFAVDVPDELLRASANARIGRKGLSMSVAALSGRQGASAAAPAPPGQRLQNRRSAARTKTLASASGADLHLLPSLLERRRTLQMGASSARLEASGAAAGEACAPDARDNPREWAAIMATSANYRSADSPPVIAFDDGDRAPPPTAASAGRANRRPSPADSLRSSASKSRGRNLVVACGGRKQQVGAGVVGGARRPALLVRRPNLGTCVGKLRLLRLRAALGKRPPSAAAEEGAGDSRAAVAAGGDESARRRAPETANNDGSSETNRDDGRAARDGDKAADELGELPAPAAALGRRQERLQRRSAEQQAKRPQLAPNGCQLLATRPLAALNDDTQLYAIPKKPKAKQEQHQQQVAASKARGAHQQQANNGAEQQHSAKVGADKRAPSPVTLEQLPAAPDEPATRTPSAGPALTTSDGGRSSSSADSSHSARQSPFGEPSRSSSPIASSSDGCIDLVCVGQPKQARQASQLELRGSCAPDKCSSPASPPQTTAPGDCERPAVVGVHGLPEGELCAPGYSVIGARPESSEPCLCRPAYGRQQQQQQSEVGAPGFESGRPEAEQQQVARGAKQASSVAQTTSGAGGQTRTSKLRQLLHLESRSKQANGSSGGRSNCKQSASSRAQKPTVVRTIQSATGPGTAKGTTTVQVVAKDRPAGESTAAAPAALIGTRQAPAMSAIAGGYYAYSPALRSSSESRAAAGAGEDQQLALAKQQAAAAADSAGNSKSGTKKSWLMSKFSPSSNSIAHASANSNSTTTTSSANASPSRAPSSQQPASSSPVRLELRATNGATLAASRLAGERAFDLQAASRLLLGPEPKAELITLSGQELQRIAARPTGAPLPAAARDELSFHHAQLRLHQQQQQLQQQLIRPKSALSATSASLIAAQKSLAAAAAAKVRRDRMVKLGGGERDDCYDDYDDHDDHDDHRDDEADDDADMEKPSHQFVAGSKESVLTVKTSEPPFWSQRQSQLHHQPLVVATAVHGSTAADHLSGGPKYLMTSASLNNHHHHHHHRSGTNSVGMSDSSPSNNGAESDNSLQTTTGSMNTDNAGAGGQAKISVSSNNSITRIEQQQQQLQSSPNPLGILSRILLNSKGFAGNRQKQLQEQPTSKQQHGISPDDDDDDDDELTVTAADSSSSTLRNGAEQQQQQQQPLHLRNGSLSPNCSPSTLSSSASNQSPQMVNGGSQQQMGLDQLHSRSRCPIVLSKSNELQPASADDEDRKKTIANGTDNKCSEHGDRESGATLTVVSSQSPPKLPSKSALKSAAAASASNHGLANGLGGHNSVSRILVESSINGLPRVSSYNQLSSSSNSLSQFKQANQLHIDDSRAAALCNYHAMSTQQQQSASHSTHYGLYSPYGYQQNATSRYSYHAQQQEQVAFSQQQQAMRPMHHLSHHDLSGPTTNGHHHHLQHLGHQQVDGQVDLTLPATAVNYEYYLEARTPTASVATGGPAHYHHPHLSQPARFHYATDANDSLMYPASNYQQDYFIYIPYASDQPSARNSSSNGTTTANTATDHHQLACQNGNS